MNAAIINLEFFKIILLYGSPALPTRGFLCNFTNLPSFFSIPPLTLPPFRAAIGAKGKTAVETPSPPPPTAPQGLKWGTPPRPDSRQEVARVRRLPRSSEHTAS